eukprot:scaffold101184_cov68-Cyclotella_meneghiniana.AAC.9
MIRYIDLPQHQLLSSGNTETRTPRNDWIVASSSIMSAERFLVPNNAAPARFLSRGSIKHPTCNYAQGCRLHMNIVGADGACWLLSNTSCLVSPLKKKGTGNSRIESNGKIQQQQNNSNSRNGNNRSNGGRNVGGNRNGNNRRQSQPRTKAILRMKQSRTKEHKIKATFTNSAGVKVKELLQTYSDGDPKDLLIELSLDVV